MENTTHKKNVQLIENRTYGSGHGSSDGVNKVHDANMNNNSTNNPLNLENSNDFLENEKLSDEQIKEILKKMSKKIRDLKTKDEEINSHYATFHGGDDHIEMENEKEGRDPVDINKNKKNEFDTFKYFQKIKNNSPNSPIHKNNNKSSNDNSYKNNTNNNNNNSFNDNSRSYSSHEWEKKKKYYSGRDNSKNVNVKMNEKMKLDGNDSGDDDNDKNDSSFWRPLVSKLDHGLKYSLNIMNILIGSLFFMTLVYYCVGNSYGFFGLSKEGNGRKDHHHVHSYKERVFKGYSLWLAPERDSDVFQRLNSTLTVLAQKYHTEQFEPHITLYAPIEDLPLPNIIQKLSPLSTSVTSFQVKVEDILFGERYFQSVLAKMTKTPELVDLNSKTLDLLGLTFPDPDYFPHLSLIYGHFDLPTKQEIKELVLDLFPDIQSVSLPITKVEIWKTVGKTKHWKYFHTIYLKKMN